METHPGHVPHRALAALETILADLFYLCRRTHSPGGRLVFLLPLTRPFAPGLLPRHEGLGLEAAYAGGHFWPFGRASATRSTKRACGEAGG